MSDANLAERIGGLVAMSSGDGRLDTLIRLTCGRALSLPPLPMEVDLIDGAAEHEPWCARSPNSSRSTCRTSVTISASSWRRLWATMLFRTVVMMFVADFVPRVWAGFEALGLGKAGNGGAVDWDHDSDPIDALLNGFVPAVARMRGLDPVTTEVVRLRGAAQHNCRLCKSLREANALDSGGSEDLYGEIEHYESADEADRCAQGGVAVRRRDDLDAVADQPRCRRGGAQALLGGAGVRADAGRDAQRAPTRSWCRWARTRRGWPRARSVLRGRRRADGLCR